MREQQEYIALLEEIIGGVLGDQYCAGDMIRSHFLIEERSAKQVYPRAKPLDHLDVCNRRLLRCIGKSSQTPDVDTLRLAWQQREKKADSLWADLRLALPSHNKRPLSPRPYIEDIPNNSLQLLQFVGERGIVNTSIIRNERCQTKQATNQQIGPLLRSGLVERPKAKPVLGNRTWEYIVKITPLGRSTLRDRFGLTVNCYPYDCERGEHRHHLITNIVACTLVDFSPMGYYYGPNSERISLKNYFGKELEIRPDVAGYWDTEILQVEIETGGTFGFYDKIKRYIASEADNVMVVCEEKSMVEKFARAVRSKRDFSEQYRECAIKFYLLSLENLAWQDEPLVISLGKKSE